MRVTIVGTGYVGLTTGLTLAHIGHTVTCVDSNPEKLKLLRAGRSPIHEFGMEELLRSLGNSVVFTDDLRGAVGDADVILIAVGTPPKAGGEADVSQVEAAAATIAEGLKAGRQYTLAVSLHAARPPLRDVLVPLNRRYPVADVVEAASAYAERTGRRVTYEMVMIDGINDTPADAQAAASLLRGRLAHVNLIPMNPVAHTPWRPSPHSRRRGMSRALPRN